MEQVEILASNSEPMSLFGSEDIKQAVTMRLFPKVIIAAMKDNVLLEIAKAVRDRALIDPSSYPSECVKDFNAYCVLADVVQD
eukprot:1669263-Pyramimonas_sp.AAC.1